MECENYDNPIDQKDCLERKTIDHRLYPELAIINVQKSQPVIVGTIIDGVLNVTHEIVYPGNSNVLPSHYINIVPVSIGFGNSNPSPYPADAFNQYVKLGSLFAIGYINSQQSLGNFILNPYMTDCGASYYDFNFTTNCFEQAKPYLGVAHFPPI